MSTAGGRGLGGDTGCTWALISVIRATVLSIPTWWMWDSKEAEEVMMTALPLYHSYAMTVCMNHTIFIAGKMILIPNQRVLDHVLNSINKHKPTLYPGVPGLYVSITNYPEVGKYDVSSIRACLSGAAGLPPEVQAGFEQLTGAKLVEVGIESEAFEGSEAVEDRAGDNEDVFFGGHGGGG